MPLLQRLEKLGIVRVDAEQKEHPRVPHAWWVTWGSWDYDGYERSSHYADDAEINARDAWELIGAVVVAMQRRSFGRRVRNYHSLERYEVQFFGLGDNPAVSEEFVGGELEATILAALEVLEDKK